VQLTHDAGQAGALLGIAVLDHVIVGREGFASLRAEGLYVPPEPIVSPVGPVVQARAGARLPLKRVHEPFGWSYDCGRCGDRVRGLDISSANCQRCLAPVVCTADTSQQLASSRSDEPAAA
jgi:hypothetical protein